MRKIVVPVMLGLGLMSLTGCGDFGSSQNATTSAEQFVEDAEGTYAFQYQFSDEKAKYDMFNNEWTVTGDITYTDMTNGKQTQQAFTVYETTNDGANWNDINTVLH